MVGYGEFASEFGPNFGSFPSPCWDQKRGPSGAPFQAKTQGNTMVLVLLGGPKWIHSWVVLGVISGSILHPLMGYGMIRSFDGLARAGCSKENHPAISFL